MNRHCRLVGGDDISLSFHLTWPLTTPLPTSVSRVAGITGMDHCEHHEYVCAVWSLLGYFAVNFHRVAFRP
jgi:hypothetical protein